MIFLLLIIESKIRDFEQIWANLERRLAGYIFRRARNFHDGQDILQETAVRALKKWESCKGEYDRWIFGIARKVIIEKYRPRAIKIEYRDPTTGIHEVDPDTWDSPVTSIDMENMLNTLPEDDRKILELRDLEGFTLKEISEKLGIPRSNVHYYHERAKKLLREEYERMFD